MQIDLTPEQRDFVRYAMETGRVRDPAHAVQEAMALWVERERERIEFLDSLDAAEASVARGEGTEITKASMDRLVHDVIERSRHALHADEATKS